MVTDLHEPHFHKALLCCSASDPSELTENYCVLLHSNQRGDAGAPSTRRQKNISIAAPTPSTRRTGIDVTSSWQDPPAGGDDVQLGTLMYCIMHMSCLNSYNFTAQSVADFIWIEQIYDGSGVLLTGPVSLTWHLIATETVDTVLECALVPSVQQAESEVDDW